VLPAAEPAPAADFGALSQALASRLLDYQLHAYPLPDKQNFLLGSQPVLALDGDIERRFELLLAGYPEHAAALGKARSSYRFVRAELYQGNSRRHGGAGFYLGRAITDLDELAVAVLQP